MMVLSVLLSCIVSGGLICVAVLYRIQWSYQVAVLMALFVLLFCVGCNGLICVAVLCRM